MSKSNPININTNKSESKHDSETEDYCVITLDNDSPPVCSANLNMLSELSLIFNQPKPSTSYIDRYARLPTQTTFPYGMIPYHYNIEDNDLIKLSNAKKFPCIPVFLFSIFPNSSMARTILNHEYVAHNPSVDPTFVSGIYDSTRSNEPQFLPSFLGLEEQNVIVFRSKLSPIVRPSDNPNTIATILNGCFQEFEKVYRINDLTPSHDANFGIFARKGICIINVYLHGNTTDYYIQSGSVSPNGLISKNSLHKHLTDVANDHNFDCVYIDNSCDGDVTNETETDVAGCSPINEVIKMCAKDFVPDSIVKPFPVKSSCYFAEELEEQLHYIHPFESPLYDCLCNDEFYPTFPIHHSFPTVFDSIAHTFLTTDPHIGSLSTFVEKYVSQYENHDLKSYLTELANAVIHCDNLSRIHHISSSYSYTIEDFINRSEQHSSLYKDSLVNALSDMSSDQAKAASELPPEFLFGDLYKRGCVRNTGNTYPTCAYGHVHRDGCGLYRNFRITVKPSCVNKFIMHKPTIGDPSIITQSTIYITALIHHLRCDRKGCFRCVNTSIVSKINHFFKKFGVEINCYMYLGFCSDYNSILNPRLFSSRAHTPYYRIDTSTLNHRPVMYFRDLHSPSSKLYFTNLFFQSLLTIVSVNTGYYDVSPYSPVNEVLHTPLTDLHSVIASTELAALIQNVVREPSEEVIPLTHCHQIHFNDFYDILKVLADSIYAYRRGDVVVSGFAHNHIQRRIDARFKALLSSGKDYLSDVRTLPCELV